jgi:hypothetical protein
LAAPPRLRLCRSKPCNTALTGSRHRADQACLARLCLITSGSTLKPILLRRAVRQGAGWTLQSHLQATDRGSNRARGDVPSGELSDCSSPQAASARQTFWTPSQRKGVVALVLEMPGWPSWRPSPVCVHQSVSTHPVRLRVQLSSCPVSSPSSVQSSGSLVRIWLSGRLVSSPSGVRPSAQSHSSGPTSAGWWRWGQVGMAGSRHDGNESSSMCPAPSPGRSMPGLGQGTAHRGGRG